jgi:hypothetical protein
MTDWRIGIPTGSDHVAREHSARDGFARRS